MHGLDDATVPSEFVGIDAGLLQTFHRYGQKDRLPIKQGITWTPPRKPGRLSASPIE